MGSRRMVFGVSRILFVIIFIISLLVTIVSAYEIALVSVDSGGIQGFDKSVNPSISTDGRYVAFVSRASNLVPGDMDDSWDIFVHDRQTAQTTRVSVDNEGIQGDGYSCRKNFKITVIGIIP